MASRRHVKKVIDSKLDSANQAAERILDSARKESEAIKKDEKTGWVLINPMKCIGCRSCVLSCPTGVPWFDEELKIAVKCDFCDGDPWCAKYCSAQAVQVMPRDEALALMRRIYGV